MRNVVWDVEAKGGAVQVRKLIDGEVRPQLTWHSLNAGFESVRFAEQVARTLNDAYAAGVAEGEKAGRTAGRNAVADMLDSRFDRDGYGDWQDGWRSAAKEARQHQV